MKLHPKFILAALPLALLAGPASAYQLSPPKTLSHLTGRLLFSPEGGTPFECHVNWNLKTRQRFGQIVGVKQKDNSCINVVFVDLPWSIEVNNANGGQIDGGRFVGGNGSCSLNAVIFSVNSSGVWTIPTGGCVSGTLTSNPPVTIVP
jgi:hypothetical protein